MYRRNYAEEFRELVMDCQNESMEHFRRISPNDDIIEVNGKLVLDGSLVDGIAYMEQMNTLAIEFGKESTSSHCWRFLSELSVENQIAVCNYLRRKK